MTHPPDIRYLSGFIGDDSWAVVPARSRKVHLISDGRFTEQIRREAPHAITHIRKGGLVEELAQINTRLKMRRIALSSDAVSVALRKKLAKKLGKGRFKDVDDGLLKQRCIKDKQETSLIRQAAEIQQEAFRRLLKTIKPGQTEQQIAARLEFEMRMLGADEAAFPTIVAADVNAALPHAIPGTTKVKRGGIVLIDWGARFRGYHSDMTRVIAFGRMPRAIKEIYRVVADAQQAGIAAIKPGVRLKDVDAAARKVIKRAGYGKQFSHSLGHGLGLNIHECPSLAPTAKGVLEASMVVTVEPGIYLDGVGGVRIEDDVVVTARSGRLITDLPKSLESAII